MKITVTTSSQTLAEIMSSAQLEKAREIKNNKVFYELTMANQHASADIYLEKKDDSTLADSLKLLADIGVYSTRLKNLNDLSLIADTASNDAIILDFS